MNATARKSFVALCGKIILEPCTKISIPLLIVGELGVHPVVGTI